MNKKNVGIIMGSIVAALAPIATVVACSSAGDTIAESEMMSTEEATKFINESSNLELKTFIDTNFPQYVVQSNGIFYEGIIPSAISGIVVDGQHEDYSYKKEGAEPLKYGQMAGFMGTNFHSNSNAETNRESAINLFASVYKYSNKNLSKVKLVAEVASNFGKNMYLMIPLVTVSFGTKLLNAGLTENKDTFVKKFNSYQVKDVWLSHESDKWIKKPLNALELEVKNGVIEAIIPKDVQLLE